MTSTQKGKNACDNPHSLVMILCVWRKLSYVLQLIAVITVISGFDAETRLMGHVPLY